MDQQTLLSSAVELGLHLLEQRGTFLPYCKGVNADGETFIYSPDSAEPYTVEQAGAGLRATVLHEIVRRGLVGLAFCHHVLVRYADAAEKVPAIKVELHYRGQPSAIWHFPYKLEGKRATVIEYYTADAHENLFADG